MDPYRTDGDKAEIEQPPGVSDERGILLWIFFLGLLLVVYEAGQPEPFGSVGTLGVLIALLAVRGLVGPHLSRLCRSLQRRRRAGRGERS